MLIKDIQFFFSENDFMAIGFPKYQKHNTCLKYAYDDVIK